MRLYALRVQLTEKMRPGTGREAGLGHVGRAAGVCSWPWSVALGLFPLPRLAGVTNARYVEACQVDAGLGYQGGQPLRTELRSLNPGVEVCIEHPVLPAWSFFGYPAPDRLKS